MEQLNKDKEELKQIKDEMTKIESVWKEKEKMKQAIILIESGLSLLEGDGWNGEELTLGIKQPKHLIFWYLDDSDSDSV